MHKLFLAITLTSGLFLSACGSGSTSVVTTAEGPVQGVVANGIEVFRGIPYAEPPVGERRWRAPQPVTPWEDPIVADEFGAMCWQDTSGGNSLFFDRLTEGAGMSGFGKFVLQTALGFAEPEISEDCLVLNVMRPMGASENLPVMFWIHGGGHQFGDGGTMYESPSLVREGVILVSINYRLGIYGFMAHPELAAEDPNGSTGNYGTLDQLAALQWVRRNIGQFGGDPDNVTIFGESAGAHSVGQLMASPLAHGLFHRAIAQSGTGFYQFQTTDAAIEQISGYDGGHRVAEIAGVAGSDEIAQLRAMSTEALREAATHADTSATFHPQIDGYVLPRSTAEIFASNLQAEVPLIVGSNADEGSVLYYLGLTPVDGGQATQPQTTGEWDALMADSFGPQADALTAQYRVDDDSTVVSSAEALMGDAWFGRHAFYMAQAHADGGHPTFLYFYERRPASPDETLGASHALELGHVFGDGQFMPFWPTDDRDQALAKEMRGHWARFASTGNPNSDALPEWTPFNTLEPHEMTYGHERTHSRPVARADRYRLMQPQFLARVAKAAAGQ